MKFRVFVLTVAALAVTLAACSKDSEPPEPSGAPRMGQEAPSFKLPQAQGGSVSLEDYRGRHPVLLYFSMGPGCMQQVVDLQQGSEFQGMDVALLSISPDSLDSWRAEAESLGIALPVLSDANNRVASEYGVMQWAMPTGEPGHTFVLVDETGKVRWIRDYGAPENGGLMYVEPVELTEEVRNQLSA
jgi:peroxiredoxin